MAYRPLATLSHPTFRHISLPAERTYPMPVRLFQQGSVQFADCEQICVCSLVILFQIAQMPLSVNPNGLSAPGGKIRRGR